MRFSKLKTIFLLSAFLFLMTNCSPDGLTKVKSSKDYKDFQVNAIALNADTINTVKEGDILTVELQYTAGTGYSWSYTASDASLIQQIEKKSFDVSNFGKTNKKDLVVGGKMLEIFKFKALKAGELNLKFVYSRKWEKNPKNVKQLIFKIKIQALKGE